MGAEELSGLGLGSLLIFVVLLGLFLVKKVARNRYFPVDKDDARGRAMTDLLQFQAELEARTTKGDGDSNGNALQEKGRE